MKIVNSLGDSGLMVKGITKAVENETKEQRGGFLKILFSKLGASLLGNILAVRGLVRAGDGFVLK